MKFTDTFFLRTAAQNLRACTHRMYGRKTLNIWGSLLLEHVEHMICDKLLDT